MIKVYGIKSCGSVKKALKYFQDNDLEYEFIDFKTSPVNEEKINQWLHKTQINVLFNNKGTKYRTLGLKDLNLDEKGKIEWLAKENLLIKRPVIEYHDRVIVAFDESVYDAIFKLKL
ncbi:MAG TPA: arsenate reductase family protein [Sulfurospirillum sp. UBA11407]|jgi:Spx/MgsR family transcriptional regulator|nr:MAG TPA: arsenate reductase family protein [Sulfurospirillum sp. UBA11407]